MPAQPSPAQTIFPKKDKVYTTPLRSFPTGELRTSVMTPQDQFDEPAVEPVEAEIEDAPPVRKPRKSK